MKSSILTSSAALVASLGSYALSVPAASAQSTASPYTSALRYDIAKRVVGAIKPDPDGSGSLKFAAVRNYYDDSGNLIKIERGELASWQSELIEPKNWLGFIVQTTVDKTYDDFGNLVLERSSGASGGVFSLIQYLYDELERVKCSVIRMNSGALSSPPADACAHGTVGPLGADRITKNIYDDAGQLTQIRKAVGTGLEQASATYTYTPNGKQEAVIDANGNKSTFVYDGLDRLIKWIFPSSIGSAGFNGSSPATAVATAGSLNYADYELYGYDPNGNRTTLRKRDGSMIVYQYDKLGRNTIKTVPGRSNLQAKYSRSVYYQYNINGMMTAAHFDDPTGPDHIQNTYNGFGRLISTTSTFDGAANPIGSMYDPNGNRTRLTHSDGTSFEYIYDGLDRPIAVREGVTSYLRQYVYNNAGLLLADTAGSGFSGSVSYSYDNANRLSALGHDQAGSSVDVTNAFSYNSSGQITQDQRDNDAYAYRASANGSRAYASNGLNQYSSVISVSYCYDQSGNLTSDGTNVYLYDIENRLVESRAKVNNSCPLSVADYSGTLKVSLRYDALGRLGETVGARTGLTRYVIDGDAIVNESDQSGVIQRRFVHGADGKSDDPIVWYEGGAVNANSRRFLFADRHGSIILVGDAGGNAVRIFTYDEYGIPRAGDAVALTAENGARFQYTGQAWIADLGMYYYKARIYAPMIGRFMQTDPIGYKDDLNLYAYVGNDPMNKTDPTGLSCQSNLDGPGFTCKVDRPNGMSKQDQRKAERAYTRAVNRLNYNPSRKVTLSAKDRMGNTVSKTVTAGEVRDALVEAQVSYVANSPNFDGIGAANASANGEAGTKEGVSITLYSGGVGQKEAKLGKTIMHEGAHGTVTANDIERTAKAPTPFFTRVMNGMVKDAPSQFQKTHQSSFKNAASYLYDNYKK